MTPIARRSLAVLAAGLAFAAGAAQAAWPERPITLIVPWAPAAAPTPLPASSAA